MSRVRPPPPDSRGPRLPLDAVPRMASATEARTPRAPKVPRADNARAEAARQQAQRDEATHMAAPPPRITPPPPEPPPRHLPDRPSFWRLMLRRRRPLLRPLALICLLGMVLIGVAGALQSLARSAGQAPGLDTLAGRLGMTVQSVEIVGRNKTPERAIHAALGIRLGDPILAVPLADAQARVAKIAWVQSATLERRLPGTIIVRLVERSPFAIWQMGTAAAPDFKLIDRIGNVVADSNYESFVGQVPLVVGPGAEKAAAGLVDALATQPVLAQRMVAAVRVGGRRWNLKMTNGAEVMLPEGHEVAALARLAELHANQQLLDRPLALVDLRLPDRLVLRAATVPQGGAQVPPASQAAPPSAPAVPAASQPARKT